MDKELYLIHLDDYLCHIDHKLEMYELLLELVRSLRKNLEDGEPAQALRTLCAYEQQAHEMFEAWSIPDEYAESGDPDALSQLMEDELLPAGDADGDSPKDDDDDGDNSIPSRLLRVVTMLNRSARSVLDVTTEIVDFEDEIDRMLDDMEKPENDCAG